MAKMGHVGVKSHRVFEDRLEKLSKNETRAQRLDHQEAALKRFEQRLKHLEVRSSS